MQVGWGRAGWYGYDWVDNGGKPSAWEVLPEHQRLEIGSKFPMSPWTAMYCRAFEKPRWILLQMAAGEQTKGIGSFLWYLEPIDECRTRFIIRMRDKYRWFNPIMLPVQLAVDVVDIFFQWKHMLGVKARAERMAQQHQPQVGAQPAARPDAPASSLS